MPIYKAPLDDMRFLLWEFLGLDRQADVPAFAGLDRETVDAVLEGAAQIAEEVLHPLNRSGDEEGCTWDNGVVRTPKGFQEAYRIFCEGGWNRLGTPEAFGGMGLPPVVTLAANEMYTSANQSFAMYIGLTGAATAALMGFAPDWVKAHVVPKMVSGEWTGTMNLTEPHCGTDLRLMKTKAIEQPDGTFKVSGTKIYISGGDHDLTGNIIHMVLAKVPDADGKIQDDLGQVGLFLVPKVLVKEDGTLGARNGVTCASIERKMGIKGSATCVMVYDEAVGYRIGPKPKEGGEAAAGAPRSKGQGMAGMFAMMNMARLGVGLQGMALAEVAYQNAAQYARDRLQARSISGVKHPELPADPIIVHPDVRRNLLHTRAFVEGARALGLWMTAEITAARAKGPEAREAAEAIADLMTPVIKGFFTDMGFETTNASMQVFGGAGYVRDTGVEQYVRDARILQIYEGANGIQALDLVGRKLSAKGGRGPIAFFSLVNGFAESETSADMAPFIGPLKKGLERLQRGTMWFAQHARGNPDHAGAGSTDYMRMFGIVSLAFMWAKTAKIALARLADIEAGGAGDREFYQRKLVLARYWMERMIPETAGQAARIEAGSDTLMALAAEAF